MGTRRKARELALQALFYLDTNPVDPETMIDLFCKTSQPSKKTLPFFLSLANGVIESRQEIDDVIKRFSSNWKISRMSGVDRNILRIAVYEILSCPDIPPKVSINEAIDIGKKYGTEESGSFINGILDSIHLAVEKENLKIAGQKPPDVRYERQDEVIIPKKEDDGQTSDKILRIKGSKEIVKRKGLDRAGERPEVKIS